MLPPSGKLPTSPQGHAPNKLAPLNLQKGQAETKDPLELEKDRQRALLNTLTYEIMNPVCLVAQEKLERKQRRKEEKLALQHSMYQTSMTSMNRC